MRCIRRLLAAFTAYVAFALTLGIAAGSGDGPSRPDGLPGTIASFTHEELQRDADMTQQMSAPNADANLPYHRSDGQLSRSRNSAYLAALERHQADIDRMLARGGP